MGTRSRKPAMSTHIHPNPQKFVAKRRYCLSCSCLFPSEWIGNRICDSCKRSIESRRGLEATGPHYNGHVVSKGGNK